MSSLSNLCKKSLVALSLTATLATGYAPQAKSAEIVMISTAGILGTVVVYGLGYAGYGSGLITMQAMRSRNKLEVSPRVMNEAVNAYALNDGQLSIEVSNLIVDARATFEEAEAMTDAEILEDLVLSYQAAAE